MKKINFGSALSSIFAPPDPAPVEHVKGLDPAAASPEQLGPGMARQVGGASAPEPVVQSAGPVTLVPTQFSGVGPKDTQWNAISAAIAELQPMDRGALRKKYDRPTTRMETFLSESFGKRATGETVAGIPRFELKRPPISSEEVFVYRDYTRDEVEQSTYFKELPFRHRTPVMLDYSGPGFTLPPINDAEFRFTGAELAAWQGSIRTYFAPEHYAPELLSKVLKGPVEHVSEVDDKETFDATTKNAFKAKFLVKMAQAPVLCDTSGDPLRRTDLTRPLPTIWMGSQCGMDLDFRVHDRLDTLEYVVHQDGTKISEHEARALEELRNAALGYYSDIEWQAADYQLRKILSQVFKLDRDKMIEHATRMRRMYLEAQIDCGVHVPVLIAIGCGVFARWFEEVPSIMAEADRRALSDPHWKLKGLRGAVYALPRFSLSGKEPFDVYQQTFAKKPPASLPVIFADQDALTMTRALADRGFVVSVQNPADSDLSAGEYWENRGPALEEWLALTTGMLLSQHATLNPKVTDPTTFRPLPDEDAGWGGDH